MLNIEKTLTSMEVADMMEKKHTDLLRDIRRYVKQLAESKIALGDFFTESIYKDVNNQTRPCYRITKKGCEFIAHKLTGTKGTKFTACYINRFHEMEDTIKGSAAAGTRKITFLQEIKAAEYVIKGMNQSQKIEFYKGIYERHGLHFDIQPELAIEDAQNSYCEEYRQRTIDALRTIRDEEMLRRLYIIISDCAYEMKRQSNGIK